MTAPLAPGVSTVSMMVEPAPGVYQTSIILAMVAPSLATQEDGRYISDTGIFSGSPAVNPMLTCMALAERIALGIAARW